MSRTQDDGSEDVADFLERIRELGDRNKREDEERSRKMDEEFLAGRKEREARRAERARSISPTKDSPLTTPNRHERCGTPKSPVHTSAFSLNATPSKVMPETSPRKSREMPMERSLPKTLSLDLDLEPSRPSPPTSSTLSRKGTLSWQQRPSSRGSSRPTSLLSLENRSSLSSAPVLEPITQPDAQEPSRADVARSLEGKDPAWFRQTADNGRASAAYRKNDDTKVEGSRSTVGLPGMNRATDGNARQRASDNGSLQGAPFENRNSFPTQPSSNMHSPLPKSAAQKFEPLIDRSLSRDNSPTRTLAMSPAQRGISPERSISPTKGLGGFVQSAMLRRSDSLTRHNRNGSQTGISLSRSNSVAKHQGESLYEPSKELSTTEAQNSQAGIRRTEVDVPVSPTKSSDSKRWSPTKQSWLEGAISKSDSPRPKSISVQSQPMWLSELQKAKESGSILADSDKATSHKPVEVSGLARVSKDIPSPAISPALVSTPFGVTSTTKAREIASVKTYDSPTSTHTPATTDRASMPTRTSATSQLALNAKTEAGSTKPISPLTSPKPDSLKTNSTSPDASRPASKRWGSASSNTINLESTKPDAPVKKDFRAGLRSVQNPNDKSKNEELEFKNVFGKLKRAETKNYVAPDELKDNILKGKTGLAITGGPRAFEKKDEFKDSILAKKQDMKAGVTAKVKSPEPPPKPSVPEALALRQKLSQKSTANPTVNRGDSITESKTDLPETLAIRQQLTQKPVTDSRSNPSQTTTESKPALTRTKSAVEPNTSDSLSAQHGTVSKPDVAKEQGGGGSHETVKQAALPLVSPKLPVLEKKTSAPAQLQHSVVSNKFADRFNPGLASILARGPLSGTTPPRSASPTSLQDDAASQSGQSKNSSAQLTHATKGRAKGPKRRAPGGAKSDNKDLSKITELKISPITSTSVSAVNSSIKDSTSTFEPTKASSPTVKEKPSFASTSHTERETNIPIGTKPQSPKIARTKPVLAKSIESPSKPLASKKPLILPKSPDLKANSPKSPPLPGSKTNALSRIASNGNSTDTLKVPMTGGTLHAFFDNLSVPMINTDIDTQALLNDDHSTDSKIRSLHRDIWEITGGGKKLALAPQQEHILFEDKIYLCKHHFETSNGTKSAETYLWHGDAVSFAAVEDAQIFCRTDARDAGGKLQSVSQGKETANFIEALGGILITRRGDSAAYMLRGRRHLGHVVFDEVDMLAENLCSGFTFIIATANGDIYLWKGQGANAEEIGCARLIGMDLGVTAEIVEVTQGNESEALRTALKLEDDLDIGYWPQKAVLEKYTTRLFVIDADARSRSNSSLSNFAANMWRRRPSYSNTPEPQDGNVKEISPYTQADLAEDRIYVLDTFFEIYVIAGSRARSKFGSFVLALNFAQEYGILSVSMQDRPFIPHSHVFLLGPGGTIPVGMKTAFRKWDARLQSQKDSWGPPAVVMPLHDSFRALEELSNGT